MDRVTAPSHGGFPEPILVEVALYDLESDRSPTRTIEARHFHAERRNRVFFPQERKHISRTMKRDERNGLNGVSPREANARFGWITDPSCDRGSEIWDKTLASNDFFEALPSKGSLVPGWLLAVPRRPILNLAQLSEAERQALGELIEALQKRLAIFGGEVFCFEHGSTAHGSVVGCGVDQAHLHIVPLPFDLVEAATAVEDGDIGWSAIVDDALTLLPTVGEYVAIWRAATGSGAIGAFKRPVSQWVRRIIAERLGIGEEWNYRTHPQEAQVRATVQGLTPVPIAAMMPASAG